MAEKKTKGKKKTATAEAVTESAAESQETGRITGEGAAPTGEAKEDFQALQRRREDLALDVSRAFPDKYRISGEMEGCSDAAKIDLLGFAGGSTSDQGFLRRQIISDLNYQLDRFSANWNVRYIGPTKMSPFTTGFPEIGSRVYHNVRFGFSLFDNSEVFAGVTNLFDKDPPFFASGTSGTQALDTIPAFYDVFGRSYFAGTKIRF